MPSKSAQQHRFMEAAAHNPAFAEKAGILPHFQFSHARRASNDEPAVENAGSLTEDQISNQKLRQLTSWQLKIIRPLPRIFECL